MPRLDERKRNQAKGTTGDVGVRVALGEFYGYRPSPVGRPQQKGGFVLAEVVKYSKDRSAGQ